MYSSIALLNLMRNFVRLTAVVSRSMCPYSPCNEVSASFPFSSVSTMGRLALVRGGESGIYERRRRIFAVL